MRVVARAVGAMRFTDSYNEKRLACVRTDVRTPKCPPKAFMPAAKDWAGIYRWRTFSGVRLAGGNWDNSSYCGSRCRNANNSLSNTNANNGARGRIRAESKPWKTRLKYPSMLALASKTRKRCKIRASSQKSESPDSDY